MDTAGNPCHASASSMTGGKDNGKNGIKTGCANGSPFWLFPSFWQERRCFLSCGTFPWTNSRLPAQRMLPLPFFLESLARPPCGPYPKIPPFIRQFFPDQKLCGNCHQCRAPRLLQPCPARGGNTDGRAFHRPEPFPGRFQLPNQIRIQHADKQKTGRLRPGYLPVDEKQDEGGKTGEIRKYGHRYRTE